MFTEKRKKKKIPLNVERRVQHRSEQHYAHRLAPKSVQICFIDLSAKDQSHRNSITTNKLIYNQLNVHFKLIHFFAFIVTSLLIYFHSSN